MDDALFGKRNKRGDWAPHAPLSIAPIYRLPWKASEIIDFVKDYFFPWYLAWTAIGAATWYVLLPHVETMRTLAFGWVATLFLVNCAAVLAFFGAMELQLYIKRSQGNAFKYNGRFPSDKASDVFMFGSQSIDGAIRTFSTGVPIWTAYEVLILWCYANGYGNWTTFEAHPIWLSIVFLLLPAYHECHFYLIHRPLHSPLLYRYVHSVHHNSVNPSPWSSLSMHPVEHLFFFSSALIYLIVPASPIFALIHLYLSGLGSIVGHIGFDKIVVGEKAMDTHTYNHYLHHKYFEVNYGDGVVPLDKVFGTYHDGTAEADALLDRRMEKRREQAAARAQPRNTQAG